VKKRNALQQTRGQTNVVPSSSLASENERIMNNDVVVIEERDSNERIMSNDVVVVEERENNERIMNNDVVVIEERENNERIMNNDVAMIEASETGVATQSEERMEDEIVEEEGFVERAFIPYRPRKRRRNNENEKDYQRTCYEDGREEIVLINRLKSQLETLEAEVLLAKISLLERDYKIKEFETIVSEKEKENQKLKTELKKCRQTIGMFRMWKRKRPKGTGSLQHLPKIEAESICHLFDMGLTFGQPTIS
jgi:hypothetical protein